MFILGDKVMIKRHLLEKLAGPGVSGNNAPTTENSVFTIMSVHITKESVTMGLCHKSGTFFSTFSEKDLIYKHEAPKFVREQLYLYSQRIEKMLSELEALG